MPERRTGLTTLVVFAASFVAYALLMQSQPFGDGISYLAALSKRELFAHHVLYLPDLWLGTRPLVALGISERTAAFVFSAGCAAAGNAALYRLFATSRSLVPDCRHPLGWTALVGTTGVVVFFATTVENHTHHYVWGAVFLLALDRAIGRGPGRWLLAGIALAGAFASHSSIGLLMPAVVLLTRTAAGIATWSLPQRRELYHLALLVAPVVGLKLVEKNVQVALGAPESWKEVEFSFRFMLDMMQPKSAAELFDYLGYEIVVPMAGLLAACAMFVRSTTGTVLVLAAVVPYFIVFGHWHVRELGAYYIVVAPFVAITTARCTRTGKVSGFLAAIIVAQAAFAGYQAWTWVGARVRPPWKVAAGARAVVGEDGSGLFWHGVETLHARYDQGLVSEPLENWLQYLAGEASKRPRFWHEVANDKWQEVLEAGANKGNMVVSEDLLQRLRQAPLQPLGEVLEGRFRLEPVTHGEFTGVRVLPK